MKRDGDNFTYGDYIYIKSGEKYTVYEPKGDGTYNVRENVSAAFGAESVMESAAAANWLFSDADSCWYAEDGEGDRIFELEILSEDNYKLSYIGPDRTEVSTITQFGTVKVTAPAVA